MNANFKKRLAAYIIDIFILNTIILVINMLIPTNENITNLNNELININNSYINSEININTYINRYSDIVYNIDKQSFVINFINVIIGILYFIVYPLYHDGQSLGKKIIKIKIKNSTGSSVDANSLIFRYLLINNLGTEILSMCILLVTKDLYYILGISILGFLQFIVVFVSIFMILYRRDKKSLPDLIAGTKVIEVEK